MPESENGLDRLQEQLAKLEEGFNRIPQNKAEVFAELSPSLEDTGLIIEEARKSLNDVGVMRSHLIDDHLLTDGDWEEFNKLSKEYYQLQQEYFALEEKGSQDMKKYTPIWLQAIGIKRNLMKFYK